MVEKKNNGKFDVRSLVQNDGKYEYIDVGEGTTLLLLHGLFGALSNFEGVIRHFKDKARVVVPLLPIFRLPLDKATVQGLVDFVYQFVRDKNLKDLVLVGNSLGGHVALVYSLQHPEDVRALVLTGSSGLYERTFGGSYPKRGDYQYIKEKTEYTFYDPKVATKELVDEVYNIVNDRHKALRLISMSRSAMKHNLRNELGKINKPICLIWGKQDRITPPEVAEEFKALLPDAELCYIDKCGHAPMMEHPDEFNRIMEQFLRKRNLL